VLLLSSDDIEPFLPVLQAGRNQAHGDAQRDAYDLAITNAYSSLERWAEARAADERLVQAEPDSVTAFNMFVYTCVGLKDWKAIEKAAHDRLANLADDLDAIEALANAAEHQGRMDLSVDIVRAALKSGKPRESLLNNYAWDALFLPKMPDDAIEMAQRAAHLTENRNFGVTHTLASVYAEVGRVGEARELMLKVMDDNEEPESNAWYVFGRIAEQYGRGDAALSAYNRVEKDEGEEDPHPNSTYVLAQRGIQRIHAAGKPAR